MVWLPEMSEMSKSAPWMILFCFSFPGRFIVEKNMMLGMVSMKTCHEKRETDDMHYVKENTTSEQLD